MVTKKKVKLKAPVLNVLKVIGVIFIIILL